MSEGLRLDEARHPLTILAVGLYGEVLPVKMAPGAPGRALEVRLQGRQVAGGDPPRRTAARHRLDEGRAVGIRLLRQREPRRGPPRWSQATERRIGEFTKRKTLMFNGYADQVGRYAGMDLRRFY